MFFVPGVQAAQAQISVEYRARVFDQSPLYRVLYDHYSAFQRVYPSRFQASFGLFRSCVDHTIDRFLVCGDPREGVAVYACGACSINKVVPFSCKTRLFCPSCHQKRVLLWAQDLIEHTLAQVPHRFWTFSIPKRLRPYFLHDRKLLKHLVFAAHRTFSFALSDGRIRRDLRPALITLIQTHGDELNWNCHLHLLAADGAFDTRIPQNIVFHPGPFWNLPTMTELFRFTLIQHLHKAQVLSDDVATNLMSWPHSGFHVHHSDSFPASDREQLTRRLAYAFRTPVSLSQLSYSKNAVSVRTRKGLTLTFSPVEFLAALTVHIPNVYQHYRRYAGLYASASRRFLGLKTKAQVMRTSEKPLTPRWATLLARIFGALPIECPRCHKEMRLLAFVTHSAEIRILVPGVSRAPPHKPIESFLDVHGRIPFLAAAEEPTPYESLDFNQERPESNADFDQRPSG